MLVIRRRAGESVLIGPDIEVRVLDCGSGRVTLGIAAPREVAVLRSEIRDENVAAAGSTSAEAARTLLERFRLNGG